MKKKEELDPDLEDLSKRYNDLIDKGNATSRLNSSLNERKTAMSKRIVELEKVDFQFPPEFVNMMFKLPEIHDRRESIFHEISQLHDRLETLNRKTELTFLEANKAGEWSSNQKIRIEMMLVEFDQILKKLTIKEDVRFAAYEEELSLLTKAEQSLDTFRSGG